jgi:hypothetical protein
MIMMVDDANVITLTGVAGYLKFTPHVKPVKDPEAGPFINI